MTDPPRPAPIEVLEVRRLTGDGNLRAFCKIRIGTVIIHGCRVIKQPTQKAWVAPPQVPARPKSDGSGAGWFPVVEITSKDLMARIRDAVLVAWGGEAPAPPAEPTTGPDRVAELAAAFDRRGPDEEPPF